MMEGIVELALLFFSISSVYAVSLCPEQDTNWNENVFLQHDDCQKFYKCVYGRPFEMSCPGGLYFNLETSQCDWKQNVDCGNNKSDEEGQFLENGCPRDPTVHYLLPHDNDCNLYYTCISGKKLKRSCPGSLHFDFKLQICDWPKPEGCTNTSNEDASSENDNSENNSSEEDRTIEVDTKEDMSKENDTNEDDTYEDISKEDISKENDTNEDNTKEDNSNEDISEEGVSKEDSSNEDDSSKDNTSEENTAEEENSSKIKKFEANVDVNILKE